MTDGPHETGSAAQAFYADDPSEHLRDRLSLLALRGGASSGIDELAGRGVDWGPIRLGGALEPGEAAAVQEPPDVEAVRRTAAFAAIESQVLLRQASTALVVHFCAHAASGAAPWVETSRLIRSRDWVDRLPGLAADPPDDDVLDAVGLVFLGAVRTSPSPTWLEARDTSARLLRIVATRLLADDALAVAAELALPGVADPEAPGQMAAAHDRAWLSHLAVNQLRVLWKVARQRHLGVSHDGLDLVTAAALDALAPA